MNTFRSWLEQQIGLDNKHLASQKDEQVRDIWNQIFKTLVGQQSRADAVATTLNDLTHARKREKSSSQAILDMISPLLQQLKNVSPRYAQQVADAESWLGEEKQGGAPDKTLRDLMERLFGGQYQNLLNQEDDTSDMGNQQDRLQKAPPQPPKEGAAPTQPDTPTPDPNDPNATMMPQQPQVPPNGPMMKPTNPMPPVPTGAFMGLY